MSFVIRPLLLVFVPFLVALFCFTQYYESSLAASGDVVVGNINPSRRRLGQVDKNNGRPIIYTFFELKVMDSNGERDIAGERYHYDLLDAWTQLWADAGWEPRILSLEDAEKHPNYENYSKYLIESSKMQNIPHIGAYNHLCFVRWLAMAAHGQGGWLSDYDTFPLGISTQMGLNLPNQGRFTSYARHVPALLSGTAPEWERLTRELFNMAVKIQPEYQLRPDFYSDMHALKDVHEQNPSTLEYGIGGKEILVTSYPYQRENKVYCEMLHHEGILAAHLSHAATQKAIEDGILYIPKGRTKEDRHYFAKRLTRYWRIQCKPSSPQQDPYEDFVR